MALFKRNPSKKLEKQYQQLLKQATIAQRSGNIQLYARLTAEAESVWKEIEEQENKSKNK